MQPIPPPPQGYPPPPYFYPPPPKKASLVWLWILLGVGGAVVVLGILAAIAIPSFLRYQQKAKRSDAELQLHKLRRAAMIEYDTNLAFPTGSSEPVPALGTCCAGPGHKCAPDRNQWLGTSDAPSVWDVLDFQIDEPSYFSFSYQGAPDGQSFTAHAQGDLDCDGTYIDYVLTGRVVGGNPEIELIKPARSD